MQAMMCFGRKIKFVLTAMAAGVIGGSVAWAGVSPGASQAENVRQVRILTSEQYRNTIADLFGNDIVVPGHFNPLNRTDGLLNIGASKAGMPPAAFEQYEHRARAIAAQVVDDNHRDLLVPCQPKSATAPDDTCAKAFLAKTGRLLYRRPLQSSELRAVVTLANTAGKSLNSFYGGLAQGLAVMLVAPDFLFIREDLEKNPAERGTKRLTPYAMASHISFALWNSTPDDQLLVAAEKGQLNTDTGLAREVDRLIASPRLERGVRAFFQDMLGFDAFGTLQKDPVIYPAFKLAAVEDAEEQTLRTISDLLVVRDGDYRDIFTTRKTFLSGPLGLIYRVPVADPEGWTPYEFPENDLRVGILSQLSFTALHSHPGRSSPTLRGKAIRELLMCQRVPDPPGAVEFTVVQDTNNPVHKTTRDRLKAHANEPMCAGCHRITDPIGLTLENFDGAGQLRITENGVKIDTADKIDGKDVTNAADLGRVMHDNPSVVACVVKRVFSYVNAQPIAGEGDKQAVANLEKSFAASGYRFRPLLRQILANQQSYVVRDTETKSTAR